MNTDNSNSNKIEVLEGLEAIRKRPSMYIGSTDDDGVHHLLWEIIDNSVDESLAGYCNLIKVTLKKNNKVVVEDNGRGIPFGVQEKTKKSNIETIFTILHSGGKFNNKNYKISGGLHGVGASVVNALSSELIAEVTQNYKTKRIVFINGGKLKESINEILNKNKKISGTKISFIPDQKIFKNFKNFNFDQIKNRLEEIAFLNKNLTINFFDLRDNKNKNFVFNFPDGIKSYLSRLVNIKKQIIRTPPFFSSNNDLWYQCCFNYTSTFKTRIFSFCNNINTTEGGVHEDAFKRSFLKAINEYYKNKQKITKKTIEKKYTTNDVIDGLVVIFSLRISDPEYKGQTKTKLVNQEIGSKIYYDLSSKIYEFLMENPEEGKIILEKINESYENRKEIEKLKKQRKTKLEIGSHFTLPGKLTDCKSKNKMESEIFLVEGESAGGSARICRDRFFQAILPLKGKVINVEKSNLQKIYENKEVSFIFQALGFNFEEVDNLDKLRYGKIIIMTDADVDGLHIKILLLTLFFRFFKKIILEGKLFIAQAPLYKLNLNQKSKYFFSENELILWKQDYENSNLIIQRYKGLGEMNPEELWKTTMDPQKRKLKQVEIKDMIEVDKIINNLMGSDPQKRRDFIIKNSKFKKINLII